MIDEKIEREVSVIGLGYVGLTTALSIAQAGVSVSGFEMFEEKANAIGRGEIPFQEPGLSDLLKKCLSNGSFKVEREPRCSMISFITVGTPSGKHGAIDLIDVRKASEQLGSLLRNTKSYHLIVVKSTVTPGTTEKIVKPLIQSSSKKKFGDDFGIVMNPEFLREGSALKDMMKPDRLVIGEFESKSGDTLLALYRRIYVNRFPVVLRTNPVNAEFIKYASNAFLATKISFINTIANIAYNVPGADVAIIAKGMGMDQRIGESFLNAGVGYGGSCFSKDTRALLSFSRSHGNNSKLLSSVEDTNNQQAVCVLDYAREIIGELERKKIAILGLSFKPNTDDIREAPALKIIKELIENGVGKISVFDPAAMENVRRVFGDRLEYCDDPIRTLRGADVCILITEWPIFRTLKPQDFVQNMRNASLIDGRRVFDPKIFSASLKFRAVGLGH